MVRQRLGLRLCYKTSNALPTAHQHRVVNFAASTTKKKSKVDKKLDRKLASILSSYPAYPAQPAVLELPPVLLMPPTAKPLAPHQVAMGSTHITIVVSKQLRR